jgi:hypothetical protein
MTVVSITIRLTIIPQGNTILAKGITIRNKHLVITINVRLDPPWGVNRGDIIDVAVVRQRGIGLNKTISHNKLLIAPRAYQLKISAGEGYKAKALYLS